LPAERGPCYAFSRHDDHVHEANYLHEVDVDYVDHDYVDYSRFGRVEKQLAT